MLSNQYRQGLKTKRDYLRFKAQVDRGQIDLTAAITTASQSGSEMRRLIGVGVIEPERKAFDFDIGAVPDAAALRAEDRIADFPTTSPDVRHTYEYRVSELSREVKREKASISPGANTIPRSTSLPGFRTIT